MGIIKSNVKILLDAKEAGVDFSNTATLGRLKWYVTPVEVKRIGSHYCINSSLLKSLPAYGKYADVFFKDMLGVESLATIDNSSYEGAGVTHDLNKPISTKMEKKFDVIIDSGTLEHVFNFPMAITNCMKMLKVGGTIFISAPANNYLGHGFYQFSPELFFRIFQEDNGFKLTRAIILKHPYPGAELSSNQKLYEVVDPNTVGQRVSLVSRTQILLMIEAKRITDKQIFAIYPQQSDYAAIWNKFDKSKATQKQNNLQKMNLRGTLKRILDSSPLWLRNFVWGRYQRMKYSLWNRKFFRKIKNV